MGTVICDLCLRHVGSISKLKEDSICDTRVEVRIVDLNGDGGLLRAVRKDLCQVHYLNLMEFLEGKTLYLKET